MNATDFGMKIFGQRKNHPTQYILLLINFVTIEVSTKEIKFSKLHFIE